MNASVPYPVLQLRTDSKEAIEQLGSKPKFWFRITDDTQEWLFKFARHGTGEDWSEKIAAEVAGLLAVTAARVDLAEFMGERGIACRSFVDRKQGIALIHGSEILAGRVTGYDRSKVRRQCAHSVPNIILAIKETLPDDQTRTTELKRMAGFIILDALIGNTDRHHDNWGLLRSPVPDEKAIYQAAPSFDHASSLGRELTDDARARLLEEHRILDYVSKGHGGIYLTEKDSHGENPLTLAIKMAKQHPEYFRLWIDRVRAINMQEFDRIIQKVPDARMSSSAKLFCSSMLKACANELANLPL